MRDGETSAVNGKTAVYSSTLAFVAVSVARTFPFPFLPWMVQIFKIDGEYVTADEQGMILISILPGCIALQF
jgi:hypothetical protein